MKFVSDSIAGVKQTINTETDDDEDDDYEYETEEDEELDEDEEPITQSEIDEITGVPAENNEENEEQEQNIIQDPIEQQPNEESVEIRDAESTQYQNLSETRRSSRETRPVERLTYSHMNANKIKTIDGNTNKKRKQKRSDFQKTQSFTVKKKNIYIILLDRNMIR